MAQFKLIGFILATWTCCLLSLSNSLPYPFWQQEQCTVKKLNISQLTGDWHLLYHKDNLSKKIIHSFSQVNNETLLSSVQEDGALVHNFNLTQNAHLPGKLESLVNRGTWTMAVPTFVLSFEPNEYMTLYHSKVNGSDEWAIYGRTNELSKENYDKAVQGLTCVNLVDATDGKPLLNKV